MTIPIIILLWQYDCQRLFFLGGSQDEQKAKKLINQVLIGTMLGGVGMLAGALSAKEKGIYHVAIKFKDGNESLLKIDDALYKRLIQDMF